jgi:hypothetical protein
VKEIHIHMRAWACAHTHVHACVHLPYMLGDNKNFKRICGVTRIKWNPCLRWEIFKIESKQMRETCFLKFGDTSCNALCCNWWLCKVKTVCNISIMWTWFDCLRTGTGGGLLWVRWWIFGFLRHGVSLFWPLWSRKQYDEIEIQIILFNSTPQYSWCVIIHLKSK